MKLGTMCDVAVDDRVQDKEVDFMKVLVATDGSSNSLKAVTRAVEMAQREGAQVTLMSVAYYSRTDFNEMPLNMQERLESQAQTALNEAKALFAEKGLQVETVLESGQVPANNILRKAQEGGFDKIILGSTGLTGLERVLVGSTAAKVVANACCSVTVVR